MAQPNPGGPPPTFRSNVNRAKTKKWIEAKSYSYDGDDWGDVDDYDEYGGYDEPPPPPPLQSARATGLRQRGQSASQPADQYRGPPVQQSPYGEPEPSRPQQHQGRRSFTQPLQQPGMHRQNSFDPEEERRAFHNGPSQPSAQRSATGPYPTPMSQNQSAIQDFQPDQPHLNRPRPNYQDLPPSSLPARRGTDDEARYLAQNATPQGPQNRYPSSQSSGQPPVDNHLQPMESDPSSLDFHNRRDFSPSAVPPPLQTKGSPSPNRGGSRPPRTSSLGQDSAPQLPIQGQTSTMQQSVEAASAPRPQRDRASSSQSNKSMAFVRPADIYRRMEEERERERRSQESSRPSMETIAPKLDSNKDSGYGGRPRQTSNLDPVHERRQSENALEGPTSKSKVSAMPEAPSRSEAPLQPEASLQPEAPLQPEVKVPTTSKRFDLKKPSGTEAQRGAPSLGPMLPDVARLSGFGDSFGDSFMGATGNLGGLSPSAEAEATYSASNPPRHDPQSRSIPHTQAPESRRTDLQHQPSLGFTSAVHQSFDNAQDQAPPTPSSNADSSIQRSTSGGTSVVSPIMSRGPSTATEPWNNNLPTIDDVASPTRQPAGQLASQRPINIVRKPSASQAPVQQPDNSTPPPSFVPGHRRDMSTPSSDNSPARTPLVEANRPLRSPQEVELAQATPTPTESEFSTDEHVKTASRPIDQYPTPDQLALSEGRGRPVSDHAKAASPTTPTSGSTQPQTDLANSSKVRGLADKFEDNSSRPQSSRSNTTPRASVLGSTVPNNDDLVPPRPLNDRMESFRPHLPGGWESSASIASAAGHPTPAQYKHETSQPIYTGEAPSTIAQIKDASQDAFTAAATAGSALAASLAAAAGTGYRDGQGRESEEEEEWEKNSDGMAEQGHDRGTSSNTIMQPDSSMPPVDPRVDKAASVAPTPLPKDMPTGHEESATSGYFSDPALSKPPVIGDESREGSRRNSHQLPPLSTDLQPQRPQYESDRLRREIVNELAPNTASEPSTAESVSPYPTSSKYSMDQSAGHKSTPESGGLPREHGNYWNDEDVAEDGRTADSAGLHDRTLQPQHLATASTSAHEGPEIPGLSETHNAQQDQAPLEAVETSERRPEVPPMLPHRFSWEVPLQELGPQQGPVSASSVIPAVNENPVQQTTASDSLRAPVYPEGRDATSRDTPNRHSDQSSTIAETSTLGLNNSLKSREGKREVTVDSHDTDVAIDQADNLAIDEAINDKQLPLYPGESSHANEYVSEKETLAAPSFGPGSDAPSQTTSALRDQSPLSATEKPTPVTPKSTDTPLPPAPAGAQPNIPSFRALLALKTPTERIRAYDSTREQFATLNTGLANWIAMTSSSLPEHADLLANHGRVTLGAPRLESSPRSGAPSGLSNTPTYAPGYSPSVGGGKISGKEVQAKSKELLHTAGVFGGKGMVAGKSLFSKGKSKLRGASGTDKAPPVALSSASLKPSPRGMQASREPTHELETSVDKAVSQTQSAEPHRQQVITAQSGSNTPSEQSFSKGQLGDDERSSDDYESAQSGPDEAGPPPPRTSSLFIGDKNSGVIRSQPLPKSTTSSGDTARTITQQGANPSPRKGTQSPRSTHSSNKTPTQTSFDHAKVIPTMPYALERTESPQDAQSASMLQAATTPSSDIRSSSMILPRSRYSNETSGGGIPRDADSVDAQMRQSEDEDIQPQNQPARTQPSYLTLPTPEFSPLMGEGNTGLAFSPNISRNPHSRGLSLGSIPSALDAERPPSPVSPFLQSSEEPAEQRRGRSVVPVHHGIDHDFIEESSVERARRRSPSFSRPFQTGRSSEDVRPFTDHHSQDHPAFRPSSESSDAELAIKYPPSRSSDRGFSNSREQAPEYQRFGQGAPDMPPVEPQSRSRRGSRSSAYFKKIRDSVSPSRRSRPQDVSRPSLPDSSRVSDSPQSVTREPQQLDPEEKPRRSSVFGRIKTNNSSRSDQAQSKGSSAPRAATMPIQPSGVAIAGMERPLEDKNPVNNRMSTASRLTQKLQRASTTVNQPKPEQEGAKKKRFSGIGSLFGRNPRRQNSDQTIGMPPQQAAQYRQQSGPTRRSAQRFALDDEPIEGPRMAPGQYAPTSMDSPPAQVQYTKQSQTQSQPQRDLLAYVQDRMQRQPSMTERPPQAERISAGNFNPDRNSSTYASHQSTAAPIQSSPVGSRPPPAARSTGSWSRFSQTGPSNSNPRHSQPAAPPPQPLVSLSHINDFVSSPPLGYDSRPTQRSWMEGTTPPPRTFTSPPQNPHPETRRPAGSESPPPPPPPPKDSRWAKNAESKSPSNHARSGSIPLQTRSSPAAVEQRQSLPPLQTNVSGPRRSARSSIVPANSKETLPKMDKENMTPEQKRKSRQEEIERGHLSPSDLTASGQREKMNVLLEDEAANGKEAAVSRSNGNMEDDEPIVMSATSFPGQMWQPDHLAWEGE